LSSSVTLGMPVAQLTVTGMVAGGVYQLMFDYFAGSAQMLRCNVDIRNSADTASYYTSSTNLSGNGTFNQLFTLPAGQTGILLKLYPCNDNTGHSSIVSVGQTYSWDNFSLIRVA